MTTTHVVILAGGAGRRLSGVVPTGLKPLLLANGEPLVKRLVRQAYANGLASSITVVVSPTNAAPIVEVVAANGVHYVVQPTPRGPGDALLRALRHVDPGHRALVVMGDNYIADAFFAAVYEADAALVIGTTALDDVARFTRVGTTSAPRALWSAEGPIMKTEPSTRTVWCGPLLLPVGATRQVLYAKQSPVSGELKIGPWLGAIAEFVGERWALVSGDARDIGMPEMLI